MNKLMKKIARQSLIVPEYVLRYSPIPGASLAIGSDKSFIGKVFDGYFDLLSLPFRLVNGGRDLIQVAQDTNNLTVNQFATKYGANAGSSAMNAASGLAEWLGNSYDNLAQKPLETLSAAAIVAGSMFLGSRALRFYRTKGQGSLLTRAERSFGEKIFGRPDNKKSL